MIAEATQHDKVLPMAAKPSTAEMAKKATINL
jgi:hypothetical protein